MGSGLNWDGDKGLHEKVYNRILNFLLQCQQNINLRSLFRSFFSVFGKIYVFKLLLISKVNCASKSK